MNRFVQSMTGYVPGEQPTDSQVIKLNTNEFPYDAPPEVAEAIRNFAASGGLNRYPNPTSTPLREKLAELNGVKPGEILVGNGSDEILRLLCHAFLNAGDTIAMLNPTYSLYPILGSMFGAASVEFSASTDAVIPADALRHDSAIFFLANPNPPLGTRYTAEEVSKLAAASKGIVVIDEAYVDFSEGDMVSVFQEFPNVVISRTFSKSYGLAGIRVGYAIARESVLAELNKIRDSYNVNAISQAVALAALNAQEYYREKVAAVCNNRMWFAKELSERGFQVEDSQGNFLFARHGKAQELYGFLKEKKVFVRYFNLDGLRDGLRISVGTRAQLEQVLQLVDEFTG